MQHQHAGVNLYDVPQMVGLQRAPKAANDRSANSRRGLFLLCRMPAIESNSMPAPRKQTSSPLPQAQPYESENSFSRSWNTTDRAYPHLNVVYDKTLDYAWHEKQPLNKPHRVKQAISSYDEPGNSQFGDFCRLQPAQFARYAMMPATANVQPAHAQLISTSHSNMLSLPLFQCQKNSADGWNTGLSGLPTQHHRSAAESPLFERRAISENAERHLIRQCTLQTLQRTSELSQQCRNLWYTREHLETNSGLVDAHHRPQFPSANFSDATQFTSFESIDSGPTINLQKERQLPKQPLSNMMHNQLSLKALRPTNANIRRQKYRSLLLQRQAHSETVPASRTTSMSKLCSRTAHSVKQPDELSSDDDGLSDSVAASSNPFASSMESLEQLEEIRTWVAHAVSQCSDFSNTPQFASCVVARTASAALKTLPVDRLVHSHQNGPLRTSRPQSIISVARSYETIYRDYSVDSRTDSLFRDFVRVDPRFESLRSTNSTTQRQASKLRPQYIDRERTLALSSHVQAGVQKSNNSSFSNPIVPTSLQTSDRFEHQRSTPLVCKPAIQSHHYSLIRR